MSEQTAGLGMENSIDPSHAMHTDAGEPVLGGLIACVAGALVATHHIDTLPVLAQLVAQLTLVDVWQVYRKETGV